MLGNFTHHVVSMPAYSIGIRYAIRMPCFHAVFQDKREGTYDIIPGRIAPSQVTSVVRTMY